MTFWQLYETYCINYKEGQGLSNNISATLEGRKKLWKPRDINRRGQRGTSLVLPWFRFCLPMPGLPVRSLAGELRSHLPCSQKTKTWSNIERNSVKTLKMVHIKKKKVDRECAKYVELILSLRVIGHACWWGNSTDNHTLFPCVSGSSSLSLANILVCL